MKKIMTGAAITVAATTLLFLGSCKKQGAVQQEEPSETGPPAPITEQVVPAHESAPGTGGPSMPPVQVERSVQDVEVRKRWQAVEIVVREKKEGGEAKTLEIPLGGETEVAGTPLKIKVLGFVPDFVMGPNNITTKSMDDVNPAAKIQVFEGDKEIFKGWSFRDFPGMHAFEDPRYSIRMTRAVPAE